VGDKATDGVVVAIADGALEVKSNKAKYAKKLGIWDKQFAALVVRGTWFHTG